MSEKKTKSDEIEKLKKHIEKRLFLESMSKIGNVQADYETELWHRFCANPNAYNHLFNSENLLTIEEFLSKVKTISFGNKYALWIIQRYIDNGIQRFEDLDRTQLALSYFHRYKHRLEEKDRNIMNIKSLTDLENLVEPFTELDKQKELEKLKKEEIYKDTKMLYDGPEGKILIPLNRESSIFWGKGTKWCTASTESHNYFDHYNKQGPLYIFITNEKDSYGREIKYQFHFQSQQYMDLHDYRINNSEILKTFFKNIPKEQKLYMLCVEKINLNWLNSDDNYSEEELIKIAVSRPAEMNNILEKINRFDDDFLNKIYQKRKEILPYLPSSFIDTEKVTHNYFNNLFISKKEDLKNSNEYILYETMYNYLRSDISPLLNKVDNEYFIKSFIIDQFWNGDEKSSLFLANDVLNKNCLLLRNYDPHSFFKTLVDNYEFGYIYALGLLKTGDFGLFEKKYIDLLTSIMSKIWNDFGFEDKNFVFNEKNMNKITNIAGVDIQLKDIHKILKNKCGNYFHDNEKYGEIIVEPNTCKFALEKDGKNLNNFLYKLKAGNQLSIELGKRAIKSEDFHIFDLPQELLYADSQLDSTMKITGQNGDMNAEICLKSIVKYENFRNFRAFDPFEDTNGLHTSIIFDKQKEYKKYLKINPMIVVLFEIHDLGFYEKIIKEAISYIEHQKDPIDRYRNELNIFLENVVLLKKFADMIPYEDGKRVFIEHIMLMLKDYPRNKNGMQMFAEELENEFLEWKENKFDIAENLLRKI